MTHASCTVDHGSAGCPWESETRTTPAKWAHWVIADVKPSGPAQFNQPSQYRVEINSDADGVVDGVILYDASRMLVHLERESRDEWWLGIYPQADPVDDWASDKCFDIIRERKRIEVVPR